MEKLYCLSSSSWRALIRWLVYITCDWLMITKSHLNAWVYYTEPSKSFTVDNRNGVILHWKWQFILHVNASFYFSFWFDLMLSVSHNYFENILNNLKYPSWSLALVSPWGYSSLWHPKKKKGAKIKIKIWLVYTTSILRSQIIFTNS